MRIKAQTFTSNSDRLCGRDMAHYGTDSLLQAEDKMTFVTHNEIPYSMASFMATFERGDGVEWLFFGAEPHDGVAEKGTRYEGFLADYDAPFIAEGEQYFCVEHWLWAQKARLFRDHDGFQRILHSKTLPDMRALGETIRFVNPNVWREHLTSILLEGNLHKFTQHAALFELLQSTQDQFLLYASDDDVLGMGLANADSDEWENPYLWQGENQLGFVLMAVRDRIGDLDAFEPLAHPRNPPWVVYPDIDCSDMFWRMGKGETYLVDFFRWYEALTQQERRIYQLMFPVRNGWHLP